MSQKKLYICKWINIQAYDSQLNDFKHVSVLGNAPANILFNLVKVEKKWDGAPRKCNNYKVSIDEDTLLTGVTIEKKM